MAELSLSAEIMESGRFYVSIDPNPETRAVVAQLLNNQDVSELRQLLGRRLAFGTAGLRGPMGAGYNRMNDLVILQTTQGVCKYLIQQFGEEEAKRKGVVIGYDHRRLGSLSSLGFARMSAAVLLSQGFRVYLLEDLVPTPFVAFAVKVLGTAAGIMVTASHNPPLDNGFKLYYSNGSQIIPPHDEGIAKAILSNLTPWQVYDLAGVLTHPGAIDCTSDIATQYYEGLARLYPTRVIHSPDSTTSANTGSTDSGSHSGSHSGFKVTYTAMHGVGAKWIDRAFEAVGHARVLSVPCQREPDPTFPTVAFPNPEEKGVRAVAVAIAVAVTITVTATVTVTATATVTVTVTYTNIFLSLSLSPSLQLSPLPHRIIGSERSHRLRRIARVITHHRQRPGR